MNTDELTNHLQITKEKQTFVLSLDTLEFEPALTAYANQITLWSVLKAGVKCIIPQDYIERKKYMTRSSRKRSELLKAWKNDDIKKEKKYLVAV